MSAAPKPFHVGQEVIVRNIPLPGRVPVDVIHVVKAVGRTLVTAGLPDRDWSDTKYRMDTGYENGDFPSRIVMTREQAVERDAFARERERLKENGLEFRYRTATASDFDSALLASISDLIEAHREARP